MDGYLNYIPQILNNWFDLLKKKHCTLSTKEIKHWENIKKIGLENFKKDYRNYFALKELTKYNFSVTTNINNYTCQNRSIGLPISCHKLVFLNGLFLPSFSDTVITPWVLTFDKNPNLDAISQPVYLDFFSYLTKYLSNFIIKLHLPEKSITKKPLYLLYINSGSNVDNQLTTSHYYCHLDIRKHTNSYIIEHFVNINQNKHFTGSRVLISVDENSIMNHVKLVFENQNSFHISNQSICINQFSKINSNVFFINGPKFIKHQVDSIINHIKSSISINSLAFLLKKSTCDIQTYIEHNNQDHTISKQLHKIIAQDYSTGFFNGLIKVNKNSVNTDAEMTNKNLLLNPSASIYTDPKLEIYSDAVQCKHGATIGEINKKDLFYLNTRGINQKDALKMLIYAFSEEVIKKTADSVIQNVIMKKIDHALVRRK